MYGYALQRARRGVSSDRRKPSKRQSKKFWYAHQITPERIDSTQEGWTIKTILEGILTKSKKAALQALLVDPVVISVSAAEQTLDMMLRMQSKYLGYLS